MVHPEKRLAGTVFVCDACGFAYTERKWSEACEAYCTAHNACSLEIIRHALPSS